MTRKEIEKFFDLSNLTAVVYRPQNSGLQFSLGFGDDVLPDADEDNNDYNIVKSEELPIDVAECFRDNAAAGYGLFNFIKNGNYKVLCFEHLNAVIYVANYAMKPIKTYYANFYNRNGFPQLTYKPLSDTNKNRLEKDIKRWAKAECPYRSKYRWRIWDENRTVVKEGWVSR